MSSDQAVASSSNPAEILKTAAFSRQHNVSGEQPITASDLLMAAYDPAKLHPLADLGDKLDYLLLDDDKTSELPGSQTAIPSRGWSDDLCYGTGSMYLSGKCNLFQVTLFEQYKYVMASFSPWTKLTLSRHTSNFRFLIVFISSHGSYSFSTGLAIGGAWGVREGASRPLAVSNTRLRINSVLNSVTRRGTFIGNSAGVAGKHLIPKTASTSMM